MTATNVSRPPLELWGGIECTVNRVGAQFFDQLVYNGHAHRSCDLERLAALGLKTLRYPLLWERLQPTPDQPLAWTWADDRMKRLRELDIRPIVGLVHHGSGPRHTNLTDPNFASGLATYARAIAERYPWVDAYTPVNEPNTTARFSGLYGHWYPHGRDARTFCRALVIQCRGVVLAMRAIRKINPHAHLVQTDDLGKVFSTPCLMYQAAFENERRWLTWDLLCGRINRQHPLWGYLRFQGGLAEADLTWFLENPCPPDIIGINHYLTSERFLDDRLEHYPPHLHGGNGRHGYADVEAVRVRTEGIAGISALLQEAWQRYQIPLAITEVHLGCTREEQLRWLQEVWTATQSQRQTGVDVQAVTVWSLLGAFDWHCLVTRCEGRYEPGVFDLRSPQPRPTALAAWVRNVTSGQLPAHPVLETPGWWQRPERLLYAAAVPCASPEKLQGRPLLITGRTGTLGQAFARICTQRGLAHRVVTRQELDIALPDSVEAALLRWKPWAVINTAGYVRVDEAETEVVRCQRENTLGPLTLAQACASHGIGFLTFSSDLVFNGQSRTPYREPDEVAPLNVYGRSKAAAEQVVLATMPTALVVRTSAFFGPWDASNFVTVALRTLQEGQTFLAAEDAVVSPTYVPDLVHAALDLLVDGEHGLWHLANAGNTTWAALARQAADRAGLPVDRVQACPTAALHLPARRPLFSALGSERGLILPTLDDALERYFQHRPWQSHVSPAGTPA